MDTIVYNVEGKEKGKYVLPAFFDTEVKPAVLHEVTTGYLANLRSGTHATKTRGEVSFPVQNPGNKKEQVMQEQDKKIRLFGEKAVLFSVLSREIITKKCLSKKEKLL